MPKLTMATRSTCNIKRKELRTVYTFIFLKSYLSNKAHYGKENFLLPYALSIIFKVPTHTQLYSVDELIV